MKESLVILITTLLLAASTQAAPTALPHTFYLDSLTGAVTDVTLLPGWYKVTVVPAGTDSTPGIFEAWNRWSQVSLPDKGWVNNYRYSSTDLGTIDAPDVLTTFLTDVLARDAAVPQVWHLTSAGEQIVSFSIFDNNYTDNMGGLTLQVEAIPAPSAILLSALGAGFVARVRRKRWV